VKIIKCHKTLKEIENESEILELILKEHKNLNHRGIESIYEEIKNKVYYPNLKKFVNKVINLCSVCNLTKYERQPFKLPFRETETSRKP